MLPEEAEPTTTVGDNVAIGNWALERNGFLHGFKNVH